MKKHSAVITKIKCTKKECKNRPNLFCSEYNFRIHCNRKHNGHIPRKITRVEIATAQPAESNQSRAVLDTGNFESPTKSYIHHPANFQPSFLYY